MNIIRYIKKIPGIILLAVFVFNFLHSEVGFLCHDNEMTYCQDFCKIVDGSGNPANVRVSINFHKIKVDLIITDNIIHREQKEITFLTQDNTLKYLQRTNKVYLHNNSFLI